MFIYIVEIRFGIANRHISSIIDKVISPKHVRILGSGQ